MTELKCNMCKRNFDSKESLNQHNSAKHGIGKELKKESHSFTLSKKNIYIGISIFLILIVGIAALSLLNSSPTSKVTAQTTKPTVEKLSTPIKVLGNYYEYSNEPSGTDGKVRVLFVGAEFCPFCAAERWSIVEALGRFGTLDGLKETRSASYNEPFLDLQTYNFMDAKYDSSYVKFDHKETADRNFRPLETLTSEEQRLFNIYNPRGSIPFLFIGGDKGVFVQVGSGFSPGTIQGLTFSSIENDLKNNASNKVTQSIITEANIITALICYNNENKPINVCNNPEVANLISKIR